MLRVIQISDPHVVVPPGKLSGRIDSLDLLKRAVARIEQVLPKVGPVDALLITGDVSENGDGESYAAFVEAISILGLPILAIPGNHDRREPFRDAFSDMQDLPAKGRINWSRVINGVHMIGLDTLVEGQGGGVVDEDSLSFLEDCLNQAGKAPVLLALHHPPFNCGIEFMDAIGLAGSDRLTVIVENSAADIRVVCGHVHTAITANIGPATVLSAPSICTTFDVDFRSDAPVGFTTQPGGFMLHIWDDGFRSMHIASEFGSGPYPF